MILRRKNPNDGAETDFQQRVFQALIKHGHRVEMGRIVVEEFATCSSAMLCDQVCELDLIVDGKLVLECWNSKSSYRTTSQGILRESGIDSDRAKDRFVRTEYYDVGWLDESKFESQKAFDTLIEYLCWHLDKFQRFNPRHLGKLGFNYAD